MKGIIGMIFVPIFTRPIVFVNVRAIIFGKVFGQIHIGIYCLTKTIVDIHSLLF